MLPAALVLCRRLRQQVAEALFPVHTPTFANMSALDTLPDRLDDMWMFGSGSDLISCPSSPISSVPSSSSCQGTTNSLTQQAKRDKPWTTPASSRTASARGTNGPAGVWAGDDKPRVRRGGPTLCYVPVSVALLRSHAGMHCHTCMMRLHCMLQNIAVQYECGMQLLLVCQ